MEPGKGRRREQAGRRQGGFYLRLGDEELLAWVRQAAAAQDRDLTGFIRWHLRQLRAAESARRTS